MLTRIVMPCPTLVDQGGHEFDYTNMIAEAAIERGIEPVSIIPDNLPAALPLSGRVEAMLPSYGYPASSLKRIGVILQRISSYRRMFQRWGQPDTAWFVHTLHQNEIVTMVLAWVFLLRRRQKLFVFVRQEIGVSPFKRLLIGLLRLTAATGVVAVTDGDRLAEQLSSRLGYAVPLMPIPVLLPVPLPAKGNGLVCGYFGARRVAKGFLHLPLLIEAGRLAAPDIQFIVQAYKHRDDKPDALIENATKQLKDSPDTRLIDMSLDADSFGRELASCSIILLPYDATQYREATSGVFAMAVIARAVVVITEGTWMARQAKSFALSRIISMPDGPTAAEAALAMQQAIDLARKPDRLSEREIQWCANQSATRIIDLLASNF